MEIVSSSHCSNINRAELPYGILTLDSLDTEKLETAKVLADHVAATLEAFPPKSHPAYYRRALCEQAVSCAVADDDYEDMQEEMTRLTFFAACAL